MARSMLSLGRLFCLAFSITRRSLGFAVGSPPPKRAATMISFTSLVKTFPLLASSAPFLCFIFAHLLCPAICFLLFAAHADYVNFLAVFSAAGRFKYLHGLKPFFHRFGKL